MANRWFNQFKGSLERGVVILDGYVQIQASDAGVVAETIAGASVARTGTGLYTITLEDSYNRLLSISLTDVAQGTNANHDWKVKQVLNTAGADAGATLLNVKSIVIASCASTGVPTDPVVDCGLTVHMVFRNSTVGTA